MKIGSRVVISRMDSEGDWKVPDNAAVGTLVAVEYDDLDGREVVESMTVRWDDGRVEEMTPEGDDATGPWEIKDITPMLYANLYLYDREYGGPEEGGWYYDTYSPASQVPRDWDNAPPQHGHFRSEEEAQKAIKELDAWCQLENQTRRSPSSVLSDGHYTTRLEAWPAEYFPARRPYYC